MRTEENFKFKVSISREGYENKVIAKACLSSLTSKQVGKVKMAFKQQEVTVDEFIGYATTGYAFCNLFEFEDKKYWVKSSKGYTLTYPTYRRGLNKGYFKLSFKSDEYFAGSQTVFVDVDFTRFNTITDYINCLRYKPTCAYTSYSDNEDKGGVISRRFRLVYVFDSILTKEEFKDATFAIYDAIVEDTAEPMCDLCGCSFSQYMNGSNSKESYIYNTIYSITDFPKVVVEEVEPELKPKSTEFTQELLDDINHLPYETVIRKWWAKGLRYITRTCVEFNGCYYCETPKDYVQLSYTPYKVSDGQHRRKKLYIRASLRRLIKPEISADELLYNLLIDTYKFFDNTDGVITTEVLCNKVKAALNTPVDKIQEMNTEDKPNFVINPEVTDKHNAVACARRDITNSLIGDMYDVSISVKANQIEFAEAGYKVSLSRLYQWCTDNSIVPVKSNTRKKKELPTGYNPKLSIRQNMKVLGCTLYQVTQMKKAYTA